MRYLILGRNYYYHIKGPIHEVISKNMDIETV